MMLTKRLVGGTALVFSTLTGFWGLPASLVARLAHADTRTVANATLSVAEAGKGALATPPARVAYLAGKRATKSDERRRHFQAGIEAARARLAADPNAPDGLLWLAANLGSEALERGRLKALGVVKEMEALLLKLEAVAPDYDHAAGARTLARLYHKAPSIISIGSMKRSREFWERALERAGDYPANLVLAADFFDADGDEARAKALALRYLQHPVAAADEPDAAEWGEIAARIAGHRATR
jgi:hypothetical protein